MNPRKIKFFYLPLNKEVIFCVVLAIILISYSVIGINDTKTEQTVFNPQGKAYYQGPTDEQKMALTINVAWGTEYIPQLLEILEEKKVNVTFFMVGNWIEKFPDLVVDIKKAGHELGNHGYRHRHPKKLVEEELIALIKKNEDLIENTADYKTNLFAPPYGEVDQRVVEIADKVGYKTIMWTLDTIDWQRPEADVIVKRIVPKAENGAIVLMHPTKPTVEALPEIINGLQEKNYKLVTVTELLK